jgi:hypothetical protein
MLGPEITAYLAAAPWSLGVVDTSLFYDEVPPDPDTMISIVQYGAEPDEPDLGIDGTKTRYETLRFQAVTRGAARDSNASQLLCINTRKALVAVVNRTLSGVYYIGIDCIMAPAKIDIDANFRVYWAASFRVMKVPSTS